MSLPEFSVRQVVLVNVLFFVLLLGGAVAYQSTPIDFFPEIGFNTALVRTSWNGASAGEVERLVTTRIEEELGEIEGIKEIRSVSRANTSSISVEFDETLSEAEYDAGVNDLRAAVDRVSDLPEDAGEPLVIELSTKAVFSDMRVAVVDVGGLGETPLRQVADDVHARLAEVPGVESVDVRGDHDRELRVLVDRDSAARYGLSVVEIADRIRRKNLNVPAGTFSGPEGEATLRATGDYRTIEEILDTVVREVRDGTPVRLADVARVEAGLEKRRFITRYNGQPALVLGLAKDGDSDILEVSRRIDSFIAEYARIQPEGIELHKTWDLSEWVGSRMSVLWNNLLTGVGFVMLILWLTIGFRNGALTIIAIPFSFLTALMFFPLLGITVNATSLVAMLLVSGMLVDDAIIVLENIYRRIEAGEALREAVVGGAEEVLWPVVAAVLTTCAAFGPLLLMEGTAAKFVEQLPKTVIICLLASLFECLVILPAHYMDFGSRHRPDSAPAGSRAWRPFAALAALAGRVRQGMDRGLERLRSAYLVALDMVLAFPGSFAALALGLVFLSCGSATHLDVDLFPSESSNFFVVLETPTDYGLEQTDALEREVEALLDGLVGVYVDDYFTTVGSAIAGNDDNRVAPNLAVSFLWIRDTEELRADPGIAVRETQARLDAWREAHPEGIVELRAKPPRNGPPIGRPVAARVISDDYAQAKAIALDMQAYLRELPGVTNIEDNLKPATPEYRLVVDQERATRQGLSFEDLALSLRAANDGIVASRFRDPAQDEEQDIRVLLEPRYRRGIQDLLQTEVRTPGGYLLRLGDVANVEISRGFLEFFHFERRRSVTVYADVTPERMSALQVNERLAARFADVPLRNPEVELHFGGEFEATREAVAKMIAVFPIAVLTIYGILAALFRSYLQPLVVATAIPFGLAGVVAGTQLLGYSVSMYMMYATIGLTGVVVNDSLVMVDFINRARARGLPLLEAVRTSGARRLRPILLTTATTAVALMPMALGLHGGSRSFGPFAAAITFGLIVAMLGTLFVVPLSYTLLIRGQERLRRGSLQPVAVAPAPLARAGRR